MLTRGAWLRGRRVPAIDGFDLDVPDTQANATEFGYAGSGTGARRSRRRKWALASQPAGCVAATARTLATAA